VSDDQLRALFREEDRPPAPIDVEAVIRRARRRRLPARIAVAGAGTLAAAAIVVPAALLGPRLLSPAGGAADMAAAPQAEQQPEGAGASTLSDGSASAEEPLSVEVSARPREGGTLALVATLAAGPDGAHGALGSPALSLSNAAGTAWTGSADGAPARLDLAPGETIELALVPSPAGLAPGSYDLSVALPFDADGGAGTLTILAPPLRIELPTS